MTTVRTIKLKRSSQAYGGESSAPTDLQPSTVPDSTQPTTPTEAAPAQPTEPVAPKTKTKAKEPAAPKAAPAKSTVWFMLTALLATIGLLIILGIQYSEQEYYSKAPSAWASGK